MTIPYRIIKDAHDRIKPYIKNTSLLRNPEIDRLLSCFVDVKAECTQHTGSFKLRGAMNSVLLLRPEQKDRGVVAFSSGNHAQAVAYAAQRFGIRAVIVMPSDAPDIKIENTRRYGAEVHLYDRLHEDREAIAAQYVERDKLKLIKPYDARMTIAGQGTVGLEIDAQCGELDLAPDHVVVPCSGGGLAAGIALGMRIDDPDEGTQLHTAEPANFNDMARSLKSGKILRNRHKTGTISDALMAEQPGEITFRILKEAGAKGLTVTDNDTLFAMSLAKACYGLDLEPGGAVALATLLRPEKSFYKRGDHIVVVASGGNVDPFRMDEALREYPNPLEALRLRL